MFSVVHVVGIYTIDKRRTIFLLNRKYMHIMGTYDNNNVYTKYSKSFMDTKCGVLLNLNAIMCSHLFQRFYFLSVRITFWTGEKYSTHVSSHIISCSKTNVNKRIIIILYSEECEINSHRSFYTNTMRRYYDQFLL